MAGITRTGQRALKSREKIHTGEKYWKMRRKIGSQVTVARLLGVTSATVSLRERGEVRITKEAFVALDCLVERRGVARRRRFRRGEA